MFQAVELETRIKMAAYVQGMRAARAGLNASHCPYQNDKIDGEMWLEGLCEEIERRQQLEEQVQRVLAREELTRKFVAFRAGRELRLAA